MDNSRDYLAGFGIGVSDLERSAKFYAEVLGMHQARVYHLAEMEEIVMAHEGDKKSVVILMHYTDGSKRNYSNNPIKLVFHVADAFAIIERLRTWGLEVTREPTPVPDLPGSPILAFAKDPDGYVIELIQRNKA